MVPFLDLNAHHILLRSEFTEAFEEVMDSCAFAGLQFVERFEYEFADYCGVRHAIGVGSGTDALWLVLEALGIGRGDEVITTPMTFIATAEAISRTGATPVFVDIEEVTYTLNPSALEEAITERTRAIIPVHLFGQMADMESISRLAESRGIPVIEDAAQAHGAILSGRRAGSIGAAGCFSFYPGKNLGAFGEAGAAVTDDPNLARRIRVIRDHGQQQKYHHDLIGWNCRMDGIQAAVLGIKLRNLDQNNERRRQHAGRYREMLGGLTGLIVPEQKSPEGHVHHIFAIRVPERARFLSALEEAGIGFGIHYPIPIHLQQAYRSLGYGSGSFPASERCAEEFVSLPMFPELTEIQIDRVIEAVQEAIDHLIPA